MNDVSVLFESEAAAAGLRHLPMTVMHSKGTYDFIIVGSGPQALAVAARLSEGSSDAFSDFQRERDLQLPREESRQGSILVIDKTGEWMGQWNRIFEKMDIQYLRSPSSFHMDPSDVHSLHAYSAQQKRRDDYLDTSRLFSNLPRGLKKSFTYSQDYQEFDRPSSKLFANFARRIVKDYKLGDCIIRDEVVAVRPVFCEGSAVVEGFDVHTKGGRECRGKSVIMATGLTQMQVPKWVSEISSDYPHDHLQFALSAQFSTLPDMSSKTVTIVGGGLSSSHLVMLAVKYGAKKVHLVSRKKLRVKLFDFDLEWVGRMKSKKMSEFYRLPFDQRLHTMRKAREGGSLTPEMMEKLNILVEKNALDLLECTEVNRAEWVDGSWRIDLSNGNTLQCNYVWMATGFKPDIMAEPILHDISTRFPIDCTGGLPHLTPDLRWTDGVDLFFAGAYAALQVGPDAFNLAGARRSSSRIVEAIGRRREEDEGVEGYFSVLKSILRRCFFFQWCRTEPTQSINSTFRHIFLSPPLITENPLDINMLPALSRIGLTTMGWAPTDQRNGYFKGGASEHYRMMHCALKLNSRSDLTLGVLILMSIDSATHAATPLGLTIAAES
ncbi:hypothetical protein PROFUN_00480 [Planoprotostelium fungivorum]|uniref:L-ornithine N(5)-monooxygenase [NAD(P)H] n=1 Tax=Planoprotostelium fungivorum TaxID=1890364 RepID=A0A2P6N0X7_9EUKA|nr:hypothetical protein PROFUN_00480 [Planoprotostelium fungivorum]